jgi:hypothetical protein
LQLLLSNRVYVFVIASHTSIWAQPNDCGLNLRFHRCIEFICRRRRRRQQGTPGIEYFNDIFVEAWRHYLQQERQDLLSDNKSNNTTSAYEKTGLYPFDPYCWAWTEAIESLGQTSTVVRDEKRKVQYEVYPKEDCNIVTLTPEDKKALRDGLDIDPELVFSDNIVAKIRAQSVILNKWRQAVEESAMEGNKWMDMAILHLPLQYANTDGDKVAMKLVEFRRVGQAELKAAPAKTKEDKRHEMTQQILSASPVTGTVKIEYLPDGTSDEKIQGSAIKRLGGKWTVLLENDDEFSVQQSELLNNNKYTVIAANQNLSMETKRKHKGKELRQRARDERKLKDDLQAKASNLRDERDLQLIDLIIQKNQESTLSLEQRLEFAAAFRHN